MNVRNCPHCGAPRIATSRIPNDVVVVLPCPACRELCVVFRNKVIPLSWRIIKHGTIEERKHHIAEVIAEFIDPILAEMPSMTQDSPAALPEPAEEEAEPTAPGPITQEEVERFIKSGLRQIDNPAYFKKHIG